MNAQLVANTIRLLSEQLQTSVSVMRFLSEFSQRVGMRFERKRCPVTRARSARLDLVRDRLGAFELRLGELLFRRRYDLVQQPRMDITALPRCCTRQVGS
jgi:hypothetical protein